MPRRTLCLISTFDNLGDAFLAEAEARYLATSCSSGKVIVLASEGLPDAFTQYFEQDPDLSALWLRANKRWFLRNSLRSNMVVGGGNIVRDTQWWWLLMTLLGCVLARASRGTVSAVGIGAVRIDDQHKRHIWRLILRCCNTIGVRSTGSLLAMRQFGDSVLRKVRLTHDVAFLATAGMIPVREADRRICVVSPAVDATMQVSMDTDRFVRPLARLKAEGMIDEVLILAHDPRSGLDGDYCAEMCRRIVEEVGLPTSVAGGSLTSRLTESYARACVVITARLHGLILAALHGKPVIYLAEVAEKLEPFALEFGYQQLGQGDAEDADWNHLVHYLREFDAEMLKTAVRRATTVARTNFV